jgi:hypothetical protein
MLLGILYALLEYSHCVLERGHASVYSNLPCRTTVLTRSANGHAATRTWDTPGV